VRTADGRDGWLLDHLGGVFIALGFEHLSPTPPCIRRLTVGASGDLVDVQGLIAARYGGAPGVVYLIRPDQHVAARFRDPTAADLASAFARANGRLDA
jgi:3-(3-hydroxy-phenyl)propionate hydroxylase